MKIYVRTITCIFVLTALISLQACSQNESNAHNKEIELQMTKLEADLESNLSQPREEPFNVRSFNPYIGDKWIGNAVAYGCYRAGQAPGGKSPSDAEILEDLNIIAKYWNMIRVYGADDDTKRILQLIYDNKLPIKVVQGIWMTTEENNPEQRKANINQVVLAVELAQKFPEIVVAISVGNETQVFWSGHKMKLEKVIEYIRFIRKNVTVPVTTADDYLYWNQPESKTIAAEVDFIYTHIHPLWNGKSLINGIAWMDSVYNQMKVLHPKQEIVLGETGWATSYNAEKKGDGEEGTLIKGEVGLDAQASFLIQMDEWIKKNQISTFLFEVFDESWKGGGETTPANVVEKHWGVYNEDRTPKKSFIEFLNHQNNNKE